MPCVQHTNKSDVIFTIRLITVSQTPTERYGEVFREIWRKPCPNFCITPSLTMAQPAEATPSTEEDFVVTHERVAGKINYSKLIDRFGSSPIPQSLVDRVEKLTKRPAHPFLKRGFFFSHRYGAHLPSHLVSSKLSCKSVSRTPCLANNANLRSAHSVCRTYSTQLPGTLICYASLLLKLPRE